MQTGPDERAGVAPGDERRATVVTRIAATVVTLQALTLLVLTAELGVTAVQGRGNTDVATGSALYFLVLGAMLVVVAVAVWRRRSWAYGPTVFIQLLALPMTFYMLQADFWIGAVLVGGSAMLCLGSLLSRPGREAFGRG